MTGEEKPGESFWHSNRNEIEFQKFHSKRNSFYSFNDKPFSFELTNSFQLIFHGWGGFPPPLKIDDEMTIEEESIIKKKKFRDQGFLPS